MVQLSLIREAENNRPIEVLLLDYHVVVYHYIIMLLYDYMLLYYYIKAGKHDEAVADP